MVTEQWYKRLKIGETFYSKRHLIYKTARKKSFYKGLIFKILNKIVMKNSIKKMFVAAFTVVMLSTIALTSQATEIRAGYTSLTQVKNVSKIVVSGRVNLILIQGVKEQVDVYDHYYSKNAFIQQQGSELRISSFNKDALTVVVHVNNLSAVEASNTSSVTTSGTFNLLNLQVVLKDAATAHIKTNAVSLYTTVKDQAQLTLEGTTDQYTAVMSVEGRIKMNDFSAANTNISLDEKPVANSLASRKEEVKVELLDKIF